MLHTSHTTLSLEPHHIIDLYVLIDDLVPQNAKPKGGRPTILRDSELMTALIWNILTVRQKTLKDVHRWLLLYHRGDFPKIPRYSAFIDHCHRAAPLLYAILQRLLVTTADLRFMDSTMVPVCRRIRAHDHKVAKTIAAFGKNHQGWHYGFKLHASVDVRGRLCGIAFTPANVHDAQMMPKILNEETDIAVGDTAYNARVMRTKIWDAYGTLIIAPPHPKQNKKLMTDWQHLLLLMRPKIESVFDYLKEHLQFVTSFPRSVRGYLLHYLRVLIGYQLLAL